MKRGLLLAGVLLGALLSGRGAAVGVEVETVWLSAPILPAIDVLYPSVSDFPSDRAAQEQLARDISLTYDFLLSSCSAEYAITRWQEGEPPLTPEQLYQNYEEVARCSYEKYVAKPYWGQSQLLRTLDVCETVLGPPWRMPTEADIASFSEADFERIRRLLAPPPDEKPGDGRGWGDLYFSLVIFVRSGQNQVVPVNLGEAWSAPVYSLASYPYTALRCIARTPSG